MLLCDKVIFRHKEGETMDNLNNLAVSSFDDVMLKYSLALEMLETELNVMIKSYEHTNKTTMVDHVKSRLKTKDSIIHKLNKKNYEINTFNLINHVHDIIGIRIVCPFISNVYEMIDLIKTNTKYTIKEEKDYITNPKDTGYISYHIILLMPIFLDGEEISIEAEIQIRTIAMDFWASLDHKITYKFDEVPEEVREEMYNCSLDIKTLDDKMYRLKQIADKYK
jgi:putative GTP pyrophosphokinase